MTCSRKGAEPHPLRERATSRAKAGGRDDQVDDPDRHPDSGPVADFREREWWRPLDTGLVATSGRPVDPE
jgi:hypothetical protein